MKEFKCRIEIDFEAENAQEAALKTLDWLRLSHRNDYPIIIDVTPHGTIATQSIEIR